MLLHLADPIIHQTQPTPVSCTATCIAMAVGIPVEQLGVDLNRAYDSDKAAIWLAERGIWLRPMPIWGRFGEAFRPGKVYLAGIRSQNKIGTDHAVLIDTRGAPIDTYERSGWKTFDPNKGREGAKWINWVDELDLVDCSELVQRDRRFISFGEPPAAIAPPARMSANTGD